MAKCDACGTTILFGGVKEGTYRFCNARCRDRADIVAAADQLPDEFVLEKARELHASSCPQCGGSGPVDVHTSHSIWSAVVLTRWSSAPAICCKSCGTKAKLQGLMSSAALGWWGFPWGILITPVQILRNAGGLIKPPNPTLPSEELVKIVRGQLSARLAQEERQKAADVAKAPRFPGR